MKRRTDRAKKRAERKAAQNKPGGSSRYALKLRRQQKDPALSATGHTPSERKKMADQAVHEARRRAGL